MTDSTARIVVIELKMMLDALCSAELTASGREYVKRRIKKYEDRINENSISKDTAGDNHRLVSR